MLTPYHYALFVPVLSLRVVLYWHDITQSEGCRHLDCICNIIVQLGINGVYINIEKPSSDVQAKYCEIGT